MGPMTVAALDITLGGMRRPGTEGSLRKQDACCQAKQDNENGVFFSENHER